MTVLAGCGGDEERAAAPTRTAPAEPISTLAAVRSGGSWLLKDIPDAKTP